MNGPPGSGSGDALCNAATQSCRLLGNHGPANPGYLRMQHWRRMVYPSQGGWDFVGTECIGPGNPIGPASLVAKP